MQDSEPQSPAEHSTVTYLIPSNVTQQFHYRRFHLNSQSATKLQIINAVKILMEIHKHFAREKVESPSKNTFRSCEIENQERLSFDFSMERDY